MAPTMAADHKDHVTLKKALLPIYNLGLCSRIPRGPCTTTFDTFGLKVLSIGVLWGLGI